MKLSLFVFKLLHECKQFQFIYIKVSDLSRCLFWCLCPFLSIFFRGVHGGGSRRCNKNVSVWCTLTTETTTTKWFWRLLFRIRVLLYFYTQSANPHHPKISENLWFSVSWFSQGGWVKYSIKNARVTTRNTAELDSLVATQFENNIQLYISKVLYDKRNKFEQTTAFNRIIDSIITAWKVSKHEVISGAYFPVFGLNTGKYGPEITSYLNTFHVA